MKFTKQQKLIIKKIASGDIKDIPSFIKVFNLSRSEEASCRERV